jgi:RHS repeat-associated protein
MDRLTAATTSYSFLTTGPFTVQYGYDAASNRKTMTDPQNVGTTYGYDVLNRLNSLGFNGQSFGFAYDALSRRTSLTRPNGVTTSYSYDAGSNLLSALHKKGNTTLDGATYTYDLANNRLSKQDNRSSTTTSYTYDHIYQLLTAKQGTTTKESYTYDVVGNRLSSLGVSPYTYNSSNELTALPSGSYTYDNNGNTKTKSDGTQYTWDFENRLVQVVLPGTGGTVRFKYDPFGRRIQKSGPLGTTNYLYDGANVVEETDSSGATGARYVQNRTIDEPLAVLSSGVISYYEGDGIDSGSITSLSNAAAALTNTYTYDSFGKLTISTGSIANRFRYTAREFDSETNLYGYRARYYDPAVGRFLSEDPRYFDSDIDFYTYVYNRPLDFTDPSGMRGKKKPPRPPQPQPNPDAAFYICCQGGTFGVCDGPLANSFGGNTNPFFRTWHLKCQKEHEQQHVDDFNAGLGSPWIPSDFCKGKPNGFRPGIPKGKPQDEEECRGYQRQLECLQNSPLAKSGALDSDINGIRNNQFKQFHCGCDGQK